MKLRAFTTRRLRLAMAGSLALASLFTTAGGSPAGASPPPPIDDITDGGGQPPLLITINDGEGLEGDEGAGGTIPVEVVASHAPAQDVTLRVYTGIFGFEAEPDVDFIPLDDVVTIPAGQTTTVTHVQIIGNDEPQPDRLIPVYGADLSAGKFALSGGSAILKIIDDDDPGPDPGDPDSGDGEETTAAGDTGAGNASGLPAAGASNAPSAPIATIDDGSPLEAATSIARRSGQDSAPRAVALFGVGLVLAAIVAVAWLLWHQVRLRPTSS